MDYSYLCELIHNNITIYSHTKKQPLCDESFFYPYLYLPLPPVSMQQNHQEHQKLSSSLTALLSWYAFSVTSISHGIRQWTELSSCSKTRRSMLQKSALTAH